MRTTSGATVLLAVTLPPAGCGGGDEAGDAPTGGRTVRVLDDDPGSGESSCSGECLGGPPLYLFSVDASSGDVTGQAARDDCSVVGPRGQRALDAPAGGSSFSY